MGKGKKTKAQLEKPEKARSSKSGKTPKGTETTILQHAFEATPAILVGALVVLQGGYYAGATCVIALVGLLAFLVINVASRRLSRQNAEEASAKRLSMPFPPIFLALIAIVFLVSSFAHGMSVTMLLETASWFAVAGMSLTCMQQTSQSRRRMLDNMALVGTVLSALGVLMFVGLLNFEGTVNAGRLMFTFQYANTAGLFFAVIAVLGLCSSRKGYRYASIVPIAALLMTKSAGSIILFIFAVIAIVLKYALDEKPDKRLVIGMAAGTFAVAIASFAFLHDRFAQVAQTFIERIVQMCDALSLFASNPLLGIGPDCWQFAYPIMQTAQYQAANVHCSYLQVALDGGAVALLLMIALIVLGVRALLIKREFAAIVCTLMMVVHAALDIDFQFSSSLLLLAMLVSIPTYANSDDTHGIGFVLGTRKHTVLCSFVAACALIGSIGGIVCDMRFGDLQNACIKSDTETALTLFHSDQLLFNDEAARAQMVGALFAIGDFESVIDETQDEGILSSSAQLYRAISLCEYNHYDGESLGALSYVLERYPYDVELYDAVRSYIIDRDLGSEFIAMFNEHAKHANELYIEGRASWLANQEQIELIT